MKKTGIYFAYNDWENECPVFFRVCRKQQKCLEMRYKTMNYRMINGMLGHHSLSVVQGSNCRITGSFDSAAVIIAGKSRGHDDFSIKLNVE